MAPAALITFPVPLILTAGALVGTLSASWAIRFPKAAIVFLLSLLAFGQPLRFPLPGQGGGLLLSDVAVVVVILAAIAAWLLTKQAKNLEFGIWNLAIFKIFYSMFPLILWSLFTLIIRLSELDSGNFLIALLYWVRLTATLLLLPALLILLRDKHLFVFTSKTFLVLIAVLVASGFIQLLLFPNLQLPGWDPHQGRLVSTWLDPNLFGGFLIVVLPWIVASAKVGPVAILTVMALLALLFTQSRSSFLALAITTLLLSPLLIWQLRRLHIRARQGLGVSILLSALILLLCLLFFFPERLAGIFIVDDTASLRLSSLAFAWQLATQHPWLGVGYNAYQFAATSALSAPDFTIHSRAGADNSLLTLWVTTGLVGIVTFLIPWAVTFWSFVTRALRGKATALAAATSLLALLIHSQFVNSFLYSHLLITLIIVIALAWNPSSATSSS